MFLVLTYLGLSLFAVAQGEVTLHEGSKLIGNIVLRSEVGLLVSDIPWIQLWAGGQPTYTCGPAIRLFIPSAQML